MNFIRLNPKTGELEAVTGATRSQLKTYYKNEKDFARLSKLFNQLAPEVKGLQIFPAGAVKKIIEGLGVPYVAIDPSLI